MIVTLFVLTLIVSPAAAGLDIKTEVFEWLELSYVGATGDIEYALPEVIDYNGAVVNAGSMDGYDSSYGYFESYSNSYVELIQWDTFTQVDKATGKMYISLEVEDLNPGNGVTDFSVIFVRLYKDGGAVYDDIYFYPSDSGVKQWLIRTTPNDYSYYDSARNGWVKARIYHPSFNPDRVAISNIKYGMRFTVSTATATPTPTATPPGSLPPDATSTATATVTPPGIVNNPPTAKITYVLMGGDKVILKGVESSDTDGTIEKYDWFINDVFVNGQSTFTQVFDTEGTYEIVLIVEDNDGATAQATLIVPVNIEDDGVSIIADNVDASAAEVTGTEGRTGIWFEDGALKVPGFGGLLAVMVLLILSCRKRGQD